MKNLFKALVALYAVCLTTGVNAGVIVGDKEWRQLTETVDFSWNDFDSVCDTSDGSCSGNLTNGTVGTVSFNGWTWASQGDVAGLFQGLPGWDGPSVPSFQNNSSDSSSWAPYFFDVIGFTPTSTRATSTKVGRFARGQTRSLDNPVLDFDPETGEEVFIDIYYNASLFDQEAGEGNSVDFAYTNLPRPATVIDDDVGGWFYRSATSTPSVPAPPTLALLLLPALLMVAVRRKRLSH